MKKLLHILSMLIALSLLTFSCVKEGDLDFGKIDIADNFSYDLPAPLLDTRLTFDGLLKNIDSLHVVADENGLLNLLYDKELYFDFSNMEISVPDQKFSENLNTAAIPADSTWVSEMVIFKDTSNNVFVIENAVRIDSMRLEKADFQLKINTEVRNKVQFSIVFLNLLNAAGQPLKISKTLPGVRYGNQELIVNQDLSGYLLVPDNSDPNNLHTIHTEIVTTVFRDTSAKELYHAQTYFGVDFTKIEIDYAYGYFGKQTVNPPMGTMDLDIFDRYPMTLLEIERAYVNLTVTNAFGVPLTLDAAIHTLTRNPENPSKTLTLIDKNIPPPETPFSEPTVSVFEDSIQDLVNDNLGKLPYQVSYSTTVTMNPNDDPTQKNFITKNSFMKVGIGAKIPMRLRIGGLQLSDTLAFAGLPGAADAIETFIFKANLHNGFPMDATVSLYFMDENYQIIDSVWAVRPNDPEEKPLEIVGAEVDPNTGHVIKPTIVQMAMNFSRSQIEHLSQTRYFKIDAVLNTYDHENMMINIFENSDSEGYLRVMLGCRINANGSVMDMLGN